MKMGPLMKRNERRLLPTSSSKISVPVMSEGIRSGVNWTRLNSSSMIPARVEMSRVLASPGTPTRRQWPLQKRAIRISSITLSWPTITFLISEMISAFFLPISSTWARSSSVNHNLFRCFHGPPHSQD